MEIPLENKKATHHGTDYFIAPGAVIVGSVIIEENASIWFNAVIRADNDTIRIGQETNIQDGAVLHTDRGLPLSVGRGVTVGHGAVLHGCTVGDFTLIGIHAVVLNRARIGKNCIIGANALITEDTEIPDRSLVLGTPGKIVRAVTDREIADIEDSARHYREKYRQYITALKK